MTYTIAIVGLLLTLLGVIIASLTLHYRWHRSSLERAVTEAKRMQWLEDKQGQQDATLTALEMRTNGLQADHAAHIDCLRAEGGPFIGRGELNEWRSATDRDVARFGKQLERLDSVLNQARRNGSKSADRQS